GFLQPKAKMAATAAVSSTARRNEREAKVMRCPPQTVKIIRRAHKSHPTGKRHRITGGLGATIHRNTIYCAIRHRGSMRENSAMFPSFYRVDQLGDSLWPEVVSWRGCVPSASMDQIWRVPERVDSKTI